MPWMTGRRRLMATLRCPPRGRPLSWRDAGTYSSAGHASRQTTGAGRALARTRPGGALAPLHPDARTPGRAPAGPDRARRRCLAARLRRPPLPGRGQQLVDQPPRPCRAAHRRGHRPPGTQPGTGDPGRLLARPCHRAGRAAAGHRPAPARPRIAWARARQARSLEQVILAGFSHAPAIELAERLLAIAPRQPGRAPLSRVFYADNGSAGVEVALKMAFHWFRNRGEEQRTRFIALENGYHGETLGALAVGDIPLYRRVYA